MKLFLLPVLFLFMFSCKSREAREQEVLALKEMNELATVEYVVTKIIKANDNKTWYKPGDRKILMSCQATILAGVDFSAINPENIRINGKEIFIQLPPAKLISLNIRPEDVRVEYEEVGFFRHQFSQAEKDLLMTQGESQIRTGIDALGIYEAAETNASVFISRFLRQLGYTKVTVSIGNKIVNQPQS